MNRSITEAYSQIKETVIRHGYGHEIAWQSERRFSESTEEDFLRESAWVILNCGFREAVARRLFPKLSECFMYWRCARSIVNNMDDCVARALNVFRHRGKVNAIADVVRMVDGEGYAQVKKLIDSNPIGTLIGLPYIGPVTAYHLAKNLGVGVSKPDRHLVRMSARFGYRSVHDMCQDFSEASGDAVQVVDIVLWRYSIIKPDYSGVLSGKLLARATCEV